MISTQELREQAAAHQLTEPDVQRDYVFGWLICGIFRESPLRDQIVLKGGNALRKGYFPGTRFSDDLDFSTAHGLDSGVLLAELNQVCAFAQQATGVEFDLARNQIADEQQIDRTRRVYKVRLYFKNFLAGADHITLKVRVDVTEYDRLYLPVQERNLIHPYSDADVCHASIRCVKLEEALADKLKCLLQRRYCYDLFDLVYGTFISRDIEVDRTEMMSVFLRKTIFGNSPLAAKDLLLNLPLDLFRGYWSKVVCPAASRMTFDHAVEALRDGLEALFAPLSHGQQLQAAFYPATLRNPILQAGSEQRLLRITYEGVTRETEPYALTFKRRSDGVAQEYLYVWDRTGGRSGPGIKALFHWKIQHLEITEQSFEPRFPVELSKAGDSSAAGYFSAQRVRRGTSTSRRRSRVRGGGLVYVIRCAYCGKDFRRSTRTTRLNKHKDRYGNQCYGRVGTFVRYG